MSLIDLARNKIAFADNFTKEFQPAVQVYAWVNQDGYGKPVYADPVTYHALVDLTRKQKYVGEGKLIQTVAVITLLEPVAVSVATPPKTRVNPLDPRDKIVLSDGTTAPIMDIAGFEDAGTLRPFYQIVTLGMLVK